MQGCVEVSFSSESSAPRRRVLAPVAVMALTAFVLSAAASPTSVVPLDGGEAAIVKAGDGSPITQGDPDTAFSLAVPQGTSCPGDSMHDQWRVQTFMVPSDVDLGNLSYGVIGPEGEHQYALFGADPSARSYANILTQANAFPGQPGLIDVLVPFNFAIVASESLPSGSYRIGFACTYFGSTATYWDTEVVVTNAGSFRWRLASAPASVTNTTESSTGWITGAVLAGSLAFFVLAAAIRRRRTTSFATTRLKESR